MTRYNCILLDECRHEFCVEIEANSKDEADTELEDRYPESSVVEILSPQDVRDREMYYDECARRAYEDEVYPDEY